MNASRRHRENMRGVAKLAAMALLSAAYLGLAAFRRTFTGRSALDGILGVVIGLYVCSLPARNFLSLLIYWRTEGIRFRTRRQLFWWLALNAVILISGWLVIVVGTTRFTAGHP